MNTDDESEVLDPLGGPEPPQSRGNEWAPPKPREGELLPLEPSSTENAVARLEADLQQQRDSSRSERFYWMLSLVIMFDIIVFGEAEASILMTFVFLLEMVLLIGLAAHMGVDRVQVLLEKLWTKYIERSD